MTTGNKWFLTMVASAFASVISFFQVNSYWADKHHFNTGWEVIATIAGLVAIFSLYKVYKNTNN